jgi:hypothetical protein
MTTSGFGLAALCEALQSNPQLTKKQVQAAVGRPTGRQKACPLVDHMADLIRLPICLTPNFGPNVGVYVKIGKIMLILHTLRVPKSQAEALNLGFALVEQTIK